MSLVRKIAIVEDEAEYFNELSVFLDEFLSKNGIQYEVTHFTSAVEFLKKYDFSFDLVFMDIKLPDVDGMSAIQQLRELDNEVLVIFVTSLAQYALKGYEVNAFDFIVKPIQYYNFALKLNRVLPFLKKEKNKSIVINNKYMMRKILVNDLVYIEITDHQLTFHLNSGEDVVTYGTMKTYAQTLVKYNFALCNQSYLVNLKYVTGIKGNNALVGNKSLIISRPKRKEFIRSLNEYLSMVDS